MTGLLRITRDDSACSAHIDCPRGHGCVDGICKQYCYTADDCGWEDARCEPVEVHDEAADPEWNVCVRHCDVVSPGDPAPGLQACGWGATCVPSFETDGSASTAECAPAGDGAAHQPCSDHSDPHNPPCGAGLTCEFGRCLPWCDLAVPECPDDQPCVAHPFPAGLTVADRNLGVCPDGVLYQDGFTDYGLWPSISSPRPLVDVSYGYQTYIMWLFWHGYTFTASPYQGVYGDDVVVEVDARSDWPFDLAEQALGVYCRSTYLFEVRLNGSARILAYDHEYEYEYEYCDCDYDDDDCNYECQYGYDFDPWVALSGWVSSDAIRPAEVNHITASCIGNSPVLLTLHVNGQFVLKLEDGVYDVPYQSVGLAVSTFGAETRGEFDNFFAWEP